ncbi:valine--tRNA ligase [bacterium]|nr:MAG: valine--tRNA ligase [bacterium]
MLEKAYAPDAVEKKWVDAWKEARLFDSAPATDGRRSYTVVIPPPNVTGALHIGHALNNTLQDALIRWHRLHGREACWVPGTDHGGIATQNVMEKQLKAEKLARHDLGREKFLERMQVWVRDCKKTILGQLVRLGCALDFSREAFTMDEVRARSVHHAFQRFYDEGLIYRGSRMVNWCVRCGTALSDIEVESEDRKAKLWRLRYPVKGKPGRYLVVATTRPETMLGDTAVAVHPEDERYKDLHGAEVELPLTGRTLKVVPDAMVDREFGTGAVKVTPAHDPNDYDIWTRHKGEMEGPRPVIGFDGKMLAEGVPAEFVGLPREKAREAVLAALASEAAPDGDPILAGEEDYKHAVSVCYRCQQAIEPLVSEQWFMKMEPVAAKALAAYDDGRFKIYPASWGKPYRNWLANIQDWCLSRQIWWGHRIPAWYCLSCNDLKDKPFMTVKGLKPTVSAEKPAKCAHCGKAGGDFLQDPDVLDTWFSSALWPLSVFGWPERTKDLAFYYPTEVLVTGYEILYLWVARMQMMGLWFEDKVPFPHALIHGIVRDKSGKKMSKSLGNVVDPLVMMDKHGTDAFRFAIVSQAHPGRDIPFAEESVTGPRNFVNKLWNSTRYVLDYALKNEPAPAGGYPLEKLDRAKLSLADRWILARFEAVTAEAEADVAEYNLAAAADTLYGFLWDDFCDWYVELSKPALADPARAEAAKTILVQVLSGTLKLLHPFMPYVTEELWQALKPYAGETAAFAFQAGAPRPTGWKDDEAVAQMRRLIAAVGSIRAIRSILEVPPALKLKAYFMGSNGSAPLLEKHADMVKYLARLESLELASARPPRAAVAVAGTTPIYLPLEGVVEFDKARARLEKAIEKLGKELVKADGMLGNKSFLERAPKEEVEKVKSRRDEAAAEQGFLKDTLAALAAG